MDNLSDKTKFMELYEKQHQKLLELRHLKSELSKYIGRLPAIHDQAAAHIQEAEARIRAEREESEARWRKALDTANEEAAAMTRDLVDSINTLRGCIRKTSAFLRKNEEKLDELRAQEIREVEEARNSINMPLKEDVTESERV